jgi:exosortase
MRHVNAIRIWTAARLAAVPVRLALLIAALAVAFHQSLASLLAAWSHQTPLADLALVPLLAAGLFVAAALRHRHVGGVTLGRADLAIASVSLALVGLVVAVGPVVLGNYFWPLRLDMLSLPLAAAAFVVLLFGTRSLVAFAFPLFFLFFAWPFPYTVVLEHVLSSFTEVTAWAAARIVSVTELATVVPGSGNSRLVVEHGGTSFPLSVASACSGINSAVGFLIVGLACLYVIRGGLARRLSWLLVGLVAVWVFNLLRIVALIAVGRVFGEEAAIEVLHPVAGLLALNVAFALLLLALPLFGLRLSRPTAAKGETPIARTASAEEQARVPRTLRRRLVPLALVVGLLAVANGQLAGLALAYDNDGLPAVRSLAAPPSAGGWTGERVGTYKWAKPFFGDEASWVRYRMRPETSDVAPRDRFTMWVDSIVTPDLGALNAYPVRECYDFHGFEIYADQRVTLEHGVVAQLLAYRNREGGVWHALTWQWPVRTAGGGVEHERMVMLASSIGTPLRPSVRGDGWSVQRLVMDTFNRFSRRDDPNQRLARAMMGVASRMIEARLTQARGAAA